MMIDTAGLETETEVLEIEETESVEAPEVETDDEGDEITVSIGDAPAPEVDEDEPAPGWVKELRKANREKDKRIKELEAKLTTETKPVATLPTKPKLSDFDYDEDAYDAARDSWDAQKRAFDEAEREGKTKQEAETKAWQDRLTFYETSKKALKVRDYEEAEADVRDLFNETQQGLMVHVADNPALVIYALGKNASKAKELAAITDYAKFANAIGKLEMTLKVTKRNNPPPPEKTITGGSGTGGTIDSKLERLREDAAKDGSKMAALLEYKRQLRKR